MHRLGAWVGERGHITYVLFGNKSIPNDRDEDKHERSPIGSGGSGR